MFFNTDIMKKECRRMFLCMFLLLAAVQFSGCSRSTSECLKVKDWEIIYNSRSGGVDIYISGEADKVL